MSELSASQAKIAGKCIEVKQLFHTIQTRTCQLECKQLADGALGNAAPYQVSPCCAAMALTWVRKCLRQSLGQLGRLSVVSVLQAGCHLFESGSQGEVGCLLLRDALQPASLPWNACMQSSTSKCGDGRGLLVGLRTTPSVCHAAMQKYLISILCVLCLLPQRYHLVSFYRNTLVLQIFY